MFGKLQNTVRCLNSYRYIYKLISHLVMCLHTYLYVTTPEIYNFSCGYVVVSAKYIYLLNLVHHHSLTLMRLSILVNHEISEDVLFSVLISGTKFYTFLFETSLPNVWVIKTGDQHSAKLSHVMVGGGGNLTWTSRSFLCMSVE
jgi:hypothetical protein